MISQKTSALTFSCMALALAAAMATIAAADDPPLQLKNLSAKPSAPRFVLPTDRVWPTEPGQPDICLWDGDRFAAMSITIDDNCAGDHQWWKQVTAQHDMKVTWFVITERCALGGFWGTWPDFAQLHQLGHGVQSHTVTHLHADDPLWPGIVAEYRDSAAAIEANIEGHKAVALAYPGGTFSYLNDRTVADDYYIAARGVTGTPNKANQIDYLSVNSLSGNIGRSATDAVLFGTSSISWMGDNKYLRGWLCTHFHSMSADARTAAEVNLAYIKSKEADLWVGRFEDVARYGQQRDTARLTVLENSAERVRFNLSDDMDDTLFNYPLTIKLRLRADWPSASASQNGQAIPLSLVSHEGATYALVRAVPDRGEILVTPGGEACTVLDWRSVAMHGLAGQVELPIGDGFVEPRHSGPQWIKVRFSRAVDPATLTAGAVTIAGAAAGDLAAIIGDTSLDQTNTLLTIGLSSPLPSGDVITISIGNGLLDAQGGAIGGSKNCSFKIVPGDVDGSGTVTDADILAVRAMVGQAVTAATARYDCNKSGVITGADMTTVRRNAAGQ